MKKYSVWAGEGDILYKHGEYATMRGARCAAHRASCNGDREAVICGLDRDLPSEGIERIRG